MLIFIGYLFSLINETYNTCAIHTQVIRQASIASILFAGFFGIFFISINKILLGAQVSENNKKLSTKPNTYDTPQNDTNTTPTAPSHSNNLHNNHPYL